MNNKKNHTLFKKFLIIVLSIVSVFILFEIIFLAFYIKNAQNKANNQYIAQKESEITESTTDDYNSIFGSVPEKTYFAIYGVDKNEALADVIIVGCFDKYTKQINTISVPRDTFVVMPKERISELKQLGLWAPSDGMKINAVHSYAGEKGNEFLTKQLEELLYINIDYYFELNLDAFNQIVDAIGGVEIDVPQRMYYRDPLQNLTIDLKPGLQKLDGKTAQGFVRFRQYKQGDIQRIEMQKLFLKELFSQALSKDTIIKNAPEYIKIFLNCVKTNMSITDALKYVQFISEIDINNLTMETLPGDGQTPYNHNKKETVEMVNRLFYDIMSDMSTEENIEE